ncbi:MAG: hypothetical protein Q9218_004848 [Villophora microphyllina]
MDQQDLEAATTRWKTIDPLSIGEEDEGCEAVLDNTPQPIFERWLRSLSLTMQDQETSTLPLQILSRLQIREPVVGATSVTRETAIEQQSRNRQCENSVSQRQGNLLHGQSPLLLKDQAPSEIHHINVEPPIGEESPTARYKQSVQQAAPSEIAAENERRTAIRNKWRESYLDYIADPWAGLWAERSQVAGGLSQWSCSDSQRKALQVEIGDALNSAQIEEMYVLFGLRSVSCWISLIGLRLNDLYLQHGLPGPSQASCETDSPIKQIQVLLEYIWACHEESSTSVGGVLERCYRRHILRQPSFSDDSAIGQSTYLIRTHIRAVRIAIYLVNILYRHTIPTLVDEDLDEAWAMPVAGAEQALRREPPPVERGLGEDPFLCITDFNLHNMQNLGQLQIQWTSYWDEHLELVTKRFSDVSSNVLKLYWFSPSHSRYFLHGLCGGLIEHDRAQRAEEIFQTLSLILTSSSSMATSKRRYEKLNAPVWLQLLGHSRLKTWDAELKTLPLSRFRVDDEDLLQSFCWETADHICARWSKDRKLPQQRLSYEDFPHYEKRLRKLRRYLDSQQPKSFTALGLDRRSANAYALWFAGLFGALSFLVALCALGVAITQTWSQLRGPR